MDATRWDVSMTAESSGLGAALSLAAGESVRREESCAWTE